jgi:hypothetical protein
MARDPIKRVEAMDKAGNWAMILAVTLTVAGWLATFPLIDRYYQFAFEPDSQVYTIPVTAGFYAAVRQFDLSALPELDPDKPYLDAPFVIYAAAANLVSNVNYLLRLDRALLDVKTLLIFTIRHTNAILSALSVGLFCLAVRWLFGSNLVALILSLLFLFSPQRLSVDLLRIDHVILFLIVALYYLTFRMLQLPQKSWPFILAGICAAMLANTKPNMLSHLVIPMTALFMLKYHRRLGKGVVWRFGAAFGAVLGLLMLRYLLNWDIIGDIWMARLAKLSAWYGALDKEPYTYYNWSFFSGYGIVFLLLAVIMVGIVAWITIRRWNERSHQQDSRIVLLLCFVLFSILGALSPKVPRWGVHFIPLYLFIIAAGFSVLIHDIPRFRGLNAGRVIIIGLGMLVLVPSLVLSAVEYRGLCIEAEQREISIERTRLAPRRFFQEHIKPGARVAFYKHAWANPPIFNLDYRFDFDTLAFPYLNVQLMRGFLPPTFESLESRVDVVMLEDYHLRQQIEILDRHGLHRQLSLWRRFYEGLEDRYPRIDFKSDFPNYGVRHVMIYVVDESVFDKL